MQSEFRRPRRSKELLFSTIWTHTARAGKHLLLTWSSTRLTEEQPDKDSTPSSQSIDREDQTPQTLQMTSIKCGMTPLIYSRCNNPLIIYRIQHKGNSLPKRCSEPEMKACPRITPNTKPHKIETETPNPWEASPITRPLKRKIRPSNLSSWSEVKPSPFQRARDSMKTPNPSSKKWSRNRALWTSKQSSR